MTEPSARAVVEAFIRAIEAKDFEAQGALVTDDYVDEMPQSGERVRGRDMARAIAEHYPGGVGTVDPARGSLAGADDRWIMTPSWSIVRIEGSGNTFTYTGSVTYPATGEVWHMIAIAVVRDGKIARTTTYYAPKFEAPAWRAPFVERYEP
ncbi:MAG TPA: nuclear transport factor 2 family protein [Candidatus Limnocylindrales bacterium]|nr:nuclear transport factor 2 family protein [Candidatus Limnocylindrales bacterium]